MSEHPASSGTSAPDGPGSSHISDRSLSHADREPRTPTLAAALVFRVKATLLQAAREGRNILERAPARFPAGERLSDLPVIGESRTELWTTASPSERHLIAGKVENLRRAIGRLHAAEIPAGAMFSFWRQIGRASRRRGYVPGRELREGCLVPTIGGGLCQLSSGLYDAALHAGLEIIERHPHTEIVPGSLAEIGRDATVFWNYIDLRFRGSHDFRIEAVMDSTFLTIRIRGRRNNNARRNFISLNIESPIIAENTPRSCASCGVESCFRHAEEKNPSGNFERTAYLVDDYWPEFDRYIGTKHHENDMLIIPMDGNRFGKANYAWSTGEFRHVRQSIPLALLRSYRSRRLAMQGAARQRALLEFHEKLALGYADVLKYDITHITVMQNMLPFLWRDGHLGGRTFDVLMTSLPLALLHQRLDLAATLHPESPTLADFRADDRLLHLETEALRYARRIITPHSEIAELYKEKAILIDWILPKVTGNYQERSMLEGTAGLPTIAFPAATAGRKGAYELREAIHAMAARGSGVHLVTTGSELEGKDFWSDISTERRTGDSDWLRGIQAVVLPAFVEHRPRKLLEAIARGIPVIATPSCGVENIPGVVTIPMGNPAALGTELEKILFPFRACHA